MQGTELPFTEGLGLTYDQVCLFRRAHSNAHVPALAKTRADIHIQCADEGAQWIGSPSSPDTVAAVQHRIRRSGCKPAHCRPTPTTGPKAGLAEFQPHACGNRQQIGLCRHSTCWLNWSATLRQAAVPVMRNGGVWPLFPPLFRLKSVQTSS